MDINLILELLRKSMTDVKVIKAAVKGHIYSSYLSKSSKFPCITLSFLGGASPANIEGAILSVVQAKIWTKNKTNPDSELYAIYNNITVNFHQNHKSNTSLSMGCKLRDGDVSTHPSVVLETVNNIDTYSLAAKIQCRAIFN